MGQARSILGAMAALATLAACAPSVPDSAPQGPAFGGYQDPTSYRAARDAELNGTTLPSGETAVPPGAAPSAPAGVEGDPTLTAAATALGAASPPPTEARVPSLNNPTISDEQDFGAVSNRESIETDAERLRAQREARVVVAPTAVPTRPNSGPNIVQYALTTQNIVGQKLYSRGPFTSQARFERACAGYASPDLAQEAFLQAGGPERDRLKLDPDGDGFACSWNPAPFRRAALAGARG